MQLRGRFWVQLLQPDFRSAGGKVQIGGMRVYRQVDGSASCRASKTFVDHEELLGCSSYTALHNLKTNKPGGPASEAASSVTPDQIRPLAITGMLRMKAATKSGPYHRIERRDWNMQNIPSAKHSHPAKANTNAVRRLSAELLVEFGSAMTGLP